MICDDQCTPGSDSEITKTHNTIMDEVEDWLELNERDDYWALRVRPSRRTNPSRHPLCSLANAPVDESAAFDALVYSLALQLLASCYTILQPSSANSVPLSQQTRSPRRVSALKLHSQYRLAPAAGYHARECSETASWPGLYTGPAIEDQLAQNVSRKRLSAKRAKERASRIPNRCQRGVPTSEWSDGAAPYIDRGGSSQSSSTSPSSDKDQALVPKLISQASAPNSWRRKPYIFFLNHLPSKALSPFRHHHRQHHPQYSRIPDSRKIRNAGPYITAHAVQKVSSASRLRRTQSLPRQNSSSPQLNGSIPNAGRNSLTPTLGSTPLYPLELPEIRRFSATVSEPAQEPIRVCGRGDLIVDRKEPGEPRATPYHTLFSRRGKHIYTPDAVSPGCTVETKMPRRVRQPSDYFGWQNCVPREEAISSEVQYEYEDEEGGDGNESQCSDEWPYKEAKRHTTLDRPVAMNRGQVERLRKKTLDVNAEQMLHRAHATQQKQSHLEVSGQKKKPGWWL
ncbi:hypothetical protein BDV95DRAFT_602702 [Massariosphaeria phaeospora]|uniref:Uncharacterized protein n=1 Tax=Massariosphaeria phaeospora TaxID=100035 RepID=A0A7C8MEX5_9PLEO|nr:hypothetical protein BDV95DRAFT_602702 [Massariosphaeria phaeospora]